MKIAVVGSGISGLSAAWLLSKTHQVTLYEKEGRAGGHSNTVNANVRGTTIAVDTGFIVFNPANYPNLTALFDHLKVETQDSNMSFAVSLRDGGLEYSGTGLQGLFAQPANILRPRFWSLLSDLVRFYQTVAAAAATSPHKTLGAFLDNEGYGQPFQEEHILPMAAAIWSASAKDMRDYPVSAFARFFENHGLLSLGKRSPWRTVKGGSRTYVARMLQEIGQGLCLSTPVIAIDRMPDGIIVRDAAGGARNFDHVVIATHADQALRLLDPTPQERALLGAFRYTRNRAVLHSDVSFMPKRKRAWASWNYTETGGKSRSSLSVTYWMNLLQALPMDKPLFVTLNPERSPRAGSVHREEIYEHPLFDLAALEAQRSLWDLQGQNRTWFCGAHFGAGFHEDGLQSGLAVAEQLGGGRRPWTVADESGRIHVRDVRNVAPRELVA